MKLLRFGAKGHEKPGILDDSQNIRDLSSYLEEINSATIADVSKWQDLHLLDIHKLPLITGERIGAPVSNPGKLIFVGFNSKEHALELGIDVKKNAEPTIFLKPSSAIAGPNDPILYSQKMRKLDWEAELAIIIGKQGKYISIDKASEYIFGYTCCNDLSDRFLQFDIHDTQFTKGKCFDGSAPLGPYLVTADEISNSRDLQLKLWVNGELRQDFNSGNYLLNDLAVVSFISNYFTLFPGDIISMGSAPGCAKSWGNSYLKPNDIIEFEISKIGKQRQKVMQEIFVSF